jgi:protein-S-isoprenylcysteine O-methyltransferase Ste14
MIAAWLLLVLFPFNVVARVAVAKWRDGDPGVRVSKEHLRGWAGVAGAVGVGAVVAAFGFGLRGQTTGTVRALGLAVYAVGAGLMTWAQFAMGRSWRIGVDRDEQTDLVVRGPFRVVRNPIYTGLTLVLIGTSLLCVPPLSLVAPAALIAAFEVQTRLVEEPYLRAWHAEYNSYSQRVGRFIPGIGR